MVQGCARRNVRQSHCGRSGRRQGIRDGIIEPLALLLQEVEGRLVRWRQLRPREDPGFCLHLCERLLRADKQGVPMIGLGIVAEAEHASDDGVGHADPDWEHFFADHETHAEPVVRIVRDELRPGIGIDQRTTAFVDGGMLRVSAVGHVIDKLNRPSCDVTDGLHGKSTDHVLIGIQKGRVVKPVCACQAALRAASISSS